MERRKSSVHNIEMLGLNEHANRVSGAYERVLACEGENENEKEKETEFAFDYNDKALESADRH